MLLKLPGEKKKIQWFDRWIDYFQNDMSVPLCLIFSDLINRLGLCPSYKTDTIFGLVQFSCREMWVCSQLHRSTDHFVNTFWVLSCQMLFSVGRIHRTGVWCNVWLAIKVVKMFEFRYVYIFSVQAWQKINSATEKCAFLNFFKQLLSDNWSHMFAVWWVQ